MGHRMPTIYWRGCCRSSLGLEAELNWGIPDGLVWRRSSSCNGGTCVEVSSWGDLVLMRNSADPEGAVLAFSHNEWRALVSFSLKEAGLHGGSPKPRGE
jgi:Domain of unknown function (DUF397)